MLYIYKNLIHVFFIRTNYIRTLGFNGQENLKALLTSKHAISEEILHQNTQKVNVFFKKHKHKEHIDEKALNLRNILRLRMGKIRPKK